LDGPVRVTFGVGIWASINYCNDWIVLVILNLIILTSAPLGFDNYYNNSSISSNKDYAC